MARSSRQKLKILYIAKILSEKTDEEHPITTAELIHQLSLYDISAERKSIYHDIKALEEFGMDIITRQEKPGGYYVASREFELAELKILVDSVLSSRFITENKSRELVRKLETLTSQADARMLHRQVVVKNRNKAENESIFYSVDQIYCAMNQNYTICFQYFNWTPAKEKELRKNGDFYEVSPWFLTWEDEKYYLIAYDEVSDKLKHYRVDKMLQLRMGEADRKGRELADRFDLAACAKKTFGMFAGKEETVSFDCDENLAGVCIDQFGQEVHMRGIGEGRIRVRANAEISSQFFGWVAGLGDQIKIVSPEPVQKEYREWIKGILSVY